MNVAEANAFFQLAQSLETDTTDEQRQRGAQAAEFLAKRARVCLNAGPAALQVVSLVEDVHTVIADAYEAGLDRVQLGERAVETASARGDLL